MSRATTIIRRLRETGPTLAEDMWDYLQGSEGITRSTATSAVTNAVNAGYVRRLGYGPAATLCLPDQPPRGCRETSPPAVPREVREEFEQTEAAISAATAGLEQIISSTSQDVSDAMRAGGHLSEIRLALLALRHTLEDFDPPPPPPCTQGSDAQVDRQGEL